jgi:DNA-binding response OmpR family regulator
MVDRRPTVLVAEPDPLLCSVIAMMVRDAGGAALEATSASEVLKLSHNFQNVVSLVLCDIQLIERNGFSLIQQAKGRFPGVAIVLMSAGHIPDENLRPYRILRKPFERRTLNAIIQNIF